MKQIFFIHIYYYQKANHLQQQQQAIIKHIVKTQQNMSTFSQIISNTLSNIFQITDQPSPRQQIMDFKVPNLYANVNFEQEAKDQYGNLHPQFNEPIRKGFEAVSDYVEIYTNDILTTIREIDLLCIKTANRSHQNYQKCKAQTNEQIHKKIFIPIVNATALLYKVSNQCLLKGNSIDICSKIITDHTYFLYKLAAERIKIMSYPLQQKIPEELQPPRRQNFKLNNAID